MEGKAPVNPNQWRADSPKEQEIRQNWGSTAYLDRYKCDLWERRLGRYSLFVFFMLVSSVSFYYGLTEGIEIISKLSDFLNSSSTQSYSTMNNTDFIIYPVVICTLFLSLGLTLALTLLRATYRHPTDRNIAKYDDNKSVVEIATPVAKAVAEACKSVLK